MVADLVAGGGDGTDGVGVGFGRVTGDEEGAADAGAVEQAQDTLDADDAELATGDHAGRGGAVGSDPEGNGVEVEGETDRGLVRGHAGVLPSPAPAGRRLRDSLPEGYGRRPGDG